MKFSVCVYVFCWVFLSFLVKWLALFIWQLIEIVNLVQFYFIDLQSYFPFILPIMVLTTTTTTTTATTIMIIIISEIETMTHFNEPLITYKLYLIWNICTVCSCLSTTNNNCFMKDKESYWRLCSISVLFAFLHLILKMVVFKLNK